MTKNEDVADSGKNTKKYLTKVGKAVMPTMIQEVKYEILPEDKFDEKPDENVDEKIDEKSTKKFDETPSEKYSMDQTMINMIITENRLQNTELRLSVMKMNDKLDSLLSEQQRQNLSASNNSNNEENIKKAMNKMFKQLKSEIDPNETYTGQEVVKLVATCVKNSIE